MRRAVGSSISNIILKISHLAEATTKKERKGLSILRGNFNVLKVDLDREFHLQKQAGKICRGQLQPSPSPHVPSKMFQNW